VLVLERRVGERVVIPGIRLELEVLEITASAVRIGFRAPQSVDIFRGEIWQRISFEQWAEGDEATTNEDVK
jgi:carbon storage regulator CsrA